MKILLILILISSPPPPETPETGVVLYFKEAKNYGYILSDHGAWCFFHGNDLIDEVEKGDRVIFTLTQGKKGSTAKNIRKDKEPKGELVIRKR